MGSATSQNGAEQHGPGGNQTSKLGLCFRSRVSRASLKKPFVPFQTPPASNRALGVKGNEIVDEAYMWLSTHLSR